MRLYHYTLMFVEWDRVPARIHKDGLVFSLLLWMLTWDNLSFSIFVRSMFAYVVVKSWAILLTNINALALMDASL